MIHRAAGLLLTILLLPGCPRSNQPDGPPSPDAPADAQINVAVRDLFRAYESEDAQLFMKHVHPQFTGQDRTGNSYRYGDLPRALRDDFQVMQRIRFDVTVGAPLVRESEGTARVEVEWGLRFLPEIGNGVDQALVDQKTVFTFMKDDDGLWKLFAIAGAPVFGVADREGRLVR